MHPRLGPALIAVALSAVITSAAIASAQQQDPAARRRPTFARVVDAAGAPLAGVEVTFVGGTPCLTSAASPVDVVIGTTDRRGRTQVKLLPELCYVVWALGEADEAGSVQAAEPEGFFAAGAMLELRCARATNRRLTIDGVDAWRDRGPLRYFALSPHPGTEIELAMAADGSVELPPSPEFTLEVRTAAGEPLWGTRAGGAVSIPPPQSVHVRVLDEAGAPVTGALIRHRTATRHPWRLDSAGRAVELRWRTVGVTGPDGRATVIVPYPTDPLRQPSAQEMILLASAPGRATVVGGIYGKWIYADEERKKAIGDELPFTLSRVDPVTLRPGLVPAGTRAQLLAVCKLRNGGNGYMHDPRTFVAVAGADGELAFDGVPADVHSLQLSLLLAGGERPFVFPMMVGRTLPPELRAADDGPLPLSVTDVGLQVRVTDETGGPARGAVLNLMPAVARSSLPRESMFQMPIDAAGRCTVGVASGEWILVIVTATGYVADKVTVSGRRQELPLQLSPLARMHVLLRDHQRKPVEGARLRLAGSRTIASGDPVQAGLELFTRRIRQRWQSLRSGADGALAIPFLPLENVAWRASLHWPTGATEAFAIEANVDPLELRAR
ncbi:MAG: hypothetical protein KDC98_20520 [Planctomycetes bacterium]|nr:hypothetical protein [Planctomycetota bacterium]